MTVAASVYLSVAVVAAVADWIGVWRELTTVRYVTKPLTLVALTATALALDPNDPAVRAWFVVALVLSLAGDVFLMLPADRFVAGLASFLLAHVAYVVGLVVAGLEPVGIAAGIVVVAVAFALVGRPLIAHIRRSTPEMTAPVVAYMGVISAMLVCAVGTLEPVAIAAGALFYASDALLGWGRFVRAPRWGGVAVMVTYHAAQAMFVLSLLRL
jgi:uncharacterized membrane protein YhhN